MEPNAGSGKSQPVAMTRGELVRRERSDAARNRALLLDAARELLAERSLDEITTEEIATAAGVGKGTLYRAFMDKAGLARALVDAAERALQEAILTGPPPLGPGAQVPAIERIEAFVRAYADLLERSADLLLAADAGTTTRFNTGAYGSWTSFLRSQLREISRAPRHEFAAHAILALVSPDLHVHLRREAGYSAEGFADAAAEIALRIACDHPPHP